jgi:hypothetical protein
VSRGSRIVVLLVAALVWLVPSADAGRNTTTRTVKITASAPKWTIVRDRLAITGNVTPHLTGVQVTLEQRGDFDWKAIDDQNIRPDGTFSFTAHPKKLGLVTYRVVTTKGTGFSGTSTRLPVRVLHWAYLTSVEAFAYVLPISGDVDKAPISANKVLYQHPLSLDAGCYNQWNGSAWIDLPLEQRFEMFTATVALSDNASTASTGTYTLIGAGKTLASGSLAFGESRKIKVSLDGVWRLRVRIKVPDPTGAGGCSGGYTKVVFGDAEVLGP